jgi:hypothetical protein
MKRIYKYFALAGLSAVMCLLLTLPASAQHGGGHGGGGGGGHFSGGGGFSGGHASSGFSGARSTGAVQRSGGGQRGSYASGRAYARGAGSRGYARSYGSSNYGHGNYGHGSYGRAYGWGRHGGYFYSHGYYGSLYYPYLGFGLGFLPYGYYPFDWGDDEYYFSDGFYYQYNDDQYTVVEPPVGAAVQALPSSAQSIVINGQQYYELNGVYYSAIKKDDGTLVYQIAGKDGELDTGADGTASVIPHVGDVVLQLPADCRKINLNNAIYFVSEDGIYYEQSTDGNGHTVYKIVGLEADGAGN